jgi:hypothetical protein
MTRGRSQSKPHGVALLLVLITVATAAILSWAMLSASSMRAQVDVNALDGVEASSLAESGANLALYYLRYPEQSTTELVAGASGNLHYPGQANLAPWPDSRGTVTITVINPRQDVFQITSVASVPGRSGATITRRVQAVARLNYATFKVERATYTNGGFTVTSNMTVTGDLTVAGNVAIASGGSVSGRIYAQNGASFTNGVNAAVWSPVPEYSRLQVVKDTAITPDNALTTQRAYTYNGQSYLAQQLGSTVTGTLGATSTNPLGLYFAERDTLFRNATINGTVVIRDGKSFIGRGNVTVTPAGGMPALVTEKLDVQSTVLTPANVTLNGLTWVNSSITNGLSTTTLGSLKVNGALLFGSTTAQVSSNAKFPITIAYDAAKSRVPKFAGSDTIAGITVTSWEAQ